MTQLWIIKVIDLPGLSWKELRTPSTLWQRRQNEGALWPNQPSHICTSCAGIQVGQRRGVAITQLVFNLAFLVKLKWYCHCQRPPQSLSVACNGHSHAQQNRTHLCRKDPTLCTQRPRSGLQTRECEAGKVNPAPDSFGSLIVCNGRPTEVLKHFKFFKGSTGMMPSPWLRTSSSRPFISQL